jgi:hypothetical protein
MLHFSFLFLTMPIMRMFVDWWFYQEVLRRVCIHTRAHTFALNTGSRLLLCANVVIEALFLSVYFIWTCSFVILAWFMHIELLFLSRFFLVSILTIIYIYIYIYINTVLLAPYSRFACNWCVLFKLGRRERWRAYFIYLGCARTSLPLFFMAW